ncbi:MAG: DUF362 domain-containing protein [Candidatus Sumerlaeia bacterium]|nr:DUF362 domain-containing protein [Candidatus Sumerlaeia bacterium]
MRNNNGNNITRREFIKLLLVSGATLSGITDGVHLALGAQNETKNQALKIKEPQKLSHILYPGKVVLARRENLLNPFDEVNKSALVEMLGKSLLKLTQEKDVRDAWRKILNFKSSDVIGIKINAIGGKNLTTNPALVSAITEGLISAGIKPGNIIIWERTDRELIRGGFQINTGPGEIRCFGTNASSEYDNQNIRLLGDKQIRFSKILTQDISILINVPILKDHGLAGITNALKNHYGSFDIPFQFHSNHCDPWIAELNALPEIKDKTRLIITDAIKPLCNGGPSNNNPAFRWNYGGVLVSTDPVATDVIGWEILDERRKELGLPLLAESANKPQYIFSAEKLGLGIARRDAIELVLA